MHIHQATSCVNPQELGSHHWNIETLGASGDAWNDVSIAINADGTSQGVLAVRTGFTYDENIGHALIVHSPAGDVIGCGVLREATAGIHVHEGTSCDTDETVAGHFWTPTTSPDPWKPVTYKAGREAAEKSVIVDSGYTAHENNGHTVVVHSPIDNSRLLCGVLSTDGAFSSNAGQLGTHYEPYPGTATTAKGVSEVIDDSFGNLKVRTVLEGLHPTLKTNVDSYPGTDLSTNAAKGSVAVEDVAAGKIKVHYSLTGILGSTNILTAVMGEYPDSTSNFFPSGKVTVSDKVTGGIDVAFDLAGLRSTLKATLGPYPGETSPHPTGSVAIEDQPDGSLKVYYDMVVGGVASGGLHIHSGRSCDTPEGVGGHYWSDLSVSDPWVTTTYAGDGTNAKGSFVVNSGYTYGSNVGRTVVVHNGSGEKIACGILQGTRAGVHIHAGTTCETAGEVGGHYWKDAAAPDPWTGSTISADDSTAKDLVTIMSGYQFADNIKHAVVVHSAADPAVRIGCGVLYASASLHIHTGEACNDANAVGGHYWNPEVYGDEDPWSDIAIPVKSDGTSKGTFELSTGYTYGRNIGHSVVVHAPGGARVGCGVLVEARGGIHIHEGVSCQSDDLVKDHYYNEDAGVLSDPWSRITYGGGESTVDVTAVLNSGHSSAENNGHAMVVHSAATGDRILCGLLFPGGSVDTEVVPLGGTFGPYPSTEGESVGAPAPMSVPAGFVEVLDAGFGKIEFKYQLRNVNRVLTATIGKYGGTDAANTRINGEVTVEDVSEGKIKLYYDLQDIKEALGTKISGYPGAPAAYSPAGSVTASDAGSGSISLKWSLTGLRPTLKATLETYPGQPQGPTGTVAVEDAGDGSIKVFYKMAGFSGAAKMGGLHVHTGMSCMADNLVGGHYWNDAIDTDPWLTSDKYTVESGAATGYFVLTSGYNFPENLGHVIVVHNDAGDRVACGELKVAVGGLHVHTGTSCDSAGDHYYKDTAQPDPWTSVTYTSGTTTAQGTFTVASGFDYGEHAGHAVVVHAASDGTRIGCGVLDATASLHVHTGTSCMNSGMVGGHHWNMNAGASDPWTVVMVPVSIAGTAKGEFEIFTGFTYPGNLGHAVVVHAPGGDRMGCGVLAEAVGGIHVHSGTTCETSTEVGGHFWTPDRLDPWGAVTYGAGLSTASGSFIVETGYSVSETNAHAIVIHSPIDGSRVACATASGDWDMPVPAEGQQCAFSPDALHIKYEFENLTPTLEARLEAYPGSNAEAPVLGLLDVSPNRETSSLLLDFTLFGNRPTLSSVMLPYPGLVLPTTTAAGTVKVEDVGGGVIKIHYDLVGLTPAEPAKNGPLATKLALYPGASPDYIPAGTVLVTDGTSGAVEMKWILSGLKPTLTATLSNYPGTALEPPQGTVSVEDQGDGMIKIYYDLQGFAPGAVEGGLHIHEGTSCETSAEVKGHYWSDGGFGTPDPWSSLYNVKETVAKGSFKLNSGYNIADNIGRVIVVHNDEGEKIACGVLEVAKGGIHIHSGTSCASTEQVGGHYYQASLGDPWVSEFSSGATAADGMATVLSGYQFEDNINHAVVIHSAADGSRIGCGILTASASLHIHTGTSCSDASEVGGHYYDPVYAEDPWSPYSVPVGLDGTAKGSFKLTTGYTYKQNENHAVVVHAPGGMKIGCGELEEARGGIHIHSGTSCATHDQVGGHFWTNTAADPWTAVGTYSAGAVTVTGLVDIKPGYTLSENVGRTVVVHSAADGARVLCGVLQRGKLTFHVHSGSSCANDVSVGGHYWHPRLRNDPWEPSTEVYVDEDGVAKGEIEIKTGCALDGNAGHTVVMHSPRGERVTCGILQRPAGVHIHSGTSCASHEDVGGHFYASTLADPWNIDAVALADAAGSASGAYIVDQGLNWFENNKHAVVVHAVDGSRIGCGTLNVSFDYGKVDAVDNGSGAKKGLTPGLVAFIVVLVLILILIVAFALHHEHVQGKLPGFHFTKPKHPSDGHTVANDAYEPEFQPSIEDNVLAIAMATSSFVGESEGELTLAYDDMVKVLDMEENNPWWRGICLGRKGWFPADHVAIKTIMSEPSLPKSTTGAATPNEPYGDVDAIVPAALLPAGQRQHSVLFEFVASTPEELTLEPGQLVVVEEKSDDGTWWFGSVGRESGWFPSSFASADSVDKAPVKKVPPPPPKSRKAAPDASTQLVAELAAGIYESTTDGDEGQESYLKIGATEQGALAAQPAVAAVTASSPQSSPKLAPKMPPLPPAAKAVPVPVVAKLPPKMPPLPPAAKRAAVAAAVPTVGVTPALTPPQPSTKLAPKMPPLPPTTDVAKKPPAPPASKATAPIAPPAKPILPASAPPEVVAARPAPSAPLPTPTTKPAAKVPPATAKPVAKLPPTAVKPAVPVPAPAAKQPPPRPVASTAAPVAKKPPAAVPAPAAKQPPPRPVIAAATPVAKKPPAAVPAPSAPAPSAKQPPPRPVTAAAAPVAKQPPVVVPAPKPATPSAADKAVKLAEMQAKLKLMKEKKSASPTRPVAAAKKPTTLPAKPPVASTKPTLGVKPTPGAKPSLAAKPALVPTKPAPRAARPIPSVAAKVDVEEDDDALPTAPPARPQAAARPAAAPRGRGGGGGGKEQKKATADHAAANGMELSFSSGDVIIQIGKAADATGRVKCMLANGSMGLVPISKLG
jgi:hypothetical protein